MDPSLVARLEQMKVAYTDLLGSLADAASDHRRYAELSKSLGELESPVREYAQWQSASRDADEARELLDEARTDEEKEFYGTALREAAERMDMHERRILEHLVPKDPRDERPIIVEIRAGAGGDEAALFASELLRMYQRFAEREGWKAETLDVSDSGMGGIREAVFEIHGKGAFSKLRWESGVHRVQRVPVTESSGRIHTSTATVAVLAEADEVEVDIDPGDLRIDTYRSSGPGGQHVNTTDSAIRITHAPSGIVVACQSERSQRQNKERAMRILLAKLKERAERQARAEVASERRSQVGTGERSEKIRTYNFPQNRITDHRIGLDVFGLPKVLDGEIDEIVEALGREASGAGAA